MTLSPEIERPEDQPIRTGLRLADFPHGAARARLMRRAQPRGAQALAPLVTMAIFLLGGALWIGLFGMDLLSLPVLSAIALALVAQAGGIGVLRLQAAQLASRIKEAPYRQVEETITIGPEGINREGRLIPWRLITDVVEMPGHTLALLSPLETIPLPHAGLEDGVTPEALRERIARWRAAS
ncbi:hypothetical protein [Pseudoroseicyclus aestuarii]|uniref:YcxB-like protein n=1 Tax=Pseudoroseicyclus aestuarii TaxID=1795041 RepID=A0A318SPS3_9RHOB|nr:hypothetical protein [Pseudoroseicyclus aestuarii]PYE83703.1 hypothetical protein DFP88_10361 [Pseudoroseicyclus aestuarii]